MVVDVSSRDFCNAPAPVALFRGIESQKWTVSADGDFFISLEPRPPPRMHLTQNFFEVLSKRVGN